MSEAMNLVLSTHRHSSATAWANGLATEMKRRSDSFRTIQMPYTFIRETDTRCLFSQFSSVSVPSISRHMHGSGLYANGLASSKRSLHFYCLSLHFCGAPHSLSIFDFHIFTSHSPIVRGMQPIVEASFPHSSLQFAGHAYTRI